MLIFGQSNEKSQVTSANFRDHEDHSKHRQLTTKKEGRAQKCFQTLFAHVNWPLERRFIGGKEGFLSAFWGI